MAKEQYIKGCERVCAQLQFNIFRGIGIKLDNEHWYDHVATSEDTSRVDTLS